MSTSSAPSAPQARPATPSLPPEEAFWLRYSPHHEFSLSSLGSLVLHVSVLGLIVMLAILAATLTLDKRPTQVGGLVEAEDNASTPGGGNSGPLAPGRGREVVEPMGSPVNLPPVSPGKIELPTPAPRPIAIQPNEAPGRPIEIGDTVKGLEAAHSRAANDLRQQIDNKKSGSPEAGPGGGPQGEARLDRTTKRQQRWVMTFNTMSGADYANQLAGLGAILGVKQADGSVVVYENLKQRPVQGGVRDLAAIDRIYWIDDKSESVQSLGRALGITPLPEAVVAFFPKELETTLARLELEHFRRRHANGTEDQIKQTWFQVKQTGLGRYEPSVSRQE